MAIVVPENIHTPTTKKTSHKTPTSPEFPRVLCTPPDPLDNFTWQESVLKLQ